MASIVGASREGGACQPSCAPGFGASKYGLSRTWKVLLDLLSIKTIIGFAQRPLLWFCAAVAAIHHRELGLPCRSDRAAVRAGWPLNLPFAGTGVLYGALAMFLLMGGAVGELVYATGNVDLAEYSRILVRLLSKRSARVKVNFPRFQCRPFPSAGESRRFRLARLAEYVQALNSAAVDHEVVDRARWPKRDNSSSRCGPLAADEARIRIIELSKEFGESAALAAGFDAARGRQCS